MIRISSFLRLLLVLSFIMVTAKLCAEDGYRLWLRYDQISDNAVLKQYEKIIKSYKVYGQSPTLDVLRHELDLGLNGLFKKNITEKQERIIKNQLVIGQWQLLASMLSSLEVNVSDLKPGGFLIKSINVKGKAAIIITANDDIGLLYGGFHFLKFLQTHQSIAELDYKSSPDHQVRILNHWDNLDRTIERGYAGFSIWDWHRLPDYIDPRYIDYARANASIGINAAVVTSVNANETSLRHDYLIKAKALADVMRPYGIKLYLSARFSAPVQLGGLPTADPLDPQVQKWWNDKADEIYKLIPDFGGFVVKANSEGQPGPQNYRRSHADGANMLATAVEKHGGIVMWRAFVYSAEEPEDRAKQAYNEFVSLDGTFKENVLIQVKNGAIDFQPREPFHPLFGATPKTQLMMEFQITQEYLGQGTHLVYLGPMYEEVLKADTYVKGIGSTVANVVKGEIYPQKLTAMSGVSNIGTDRNWTGHLFGQANWYVFGRMAWDTDLSARDIAEEWTRMTFTNEDQKVDQITDMMMNSHEACVNYMTPLGLHHIMGPGHHYGPGPWVKDMSRADWTSVYYHKADERGIGFDRTTTGSSATSQYSPEIAAIFENRELCPEKYLLWFHHVGWDEKLKNGKTLWQSIAYKYDEGVHEVEHMKATWSLLKNDIDTERFQQVDMMLTIQLHDARWWRNACLLYFQQFAKRPFPADIEQPRGDLEEYEKMTFPYAPGIKPRW